jgi:hypothetical protein
MAPSRNLPGFRLKLLRTLGRGAEKTAQAVRQIPSRLGVSSREPGVRLSGFVPSDGRKLSVFVPLDVIQRQPNGISLGTDPDLNNIQMHAGLQAPRIIRISTEGGAFYVECLTSDLDLYVGDERFSVFEKAMISNGSVLKMGALALDVTVVDE